MNQLGIEMPLKELEQIYAEFAKKMDDILKSENIKHQSSETK